MSKELEIKILEVDPTEIEEKLRALGCVKTLDILQKIYVYDVFTIKGLYQTIVADWDDTSAGMQDVVLNRVKQLLLELNSIITNEDNCLLCEYFNETSLLDVAEKVEHSKQWQERLTSSEMAKVISKYGVNPNKWIRLRQTGEQITITVKHILENCNISDGLQQYGLDSINETEINVDSIEVANELLETLGFYHRNYQEKKRISYIYEPLSLEIEIDTWPMIPPYMEIEGKSEEEIYRFVELLGYPKESVKIANTSGVYAMYGINIYDYKELKFS